MTLVRFRWSLNCGGRVYQTVVTAFKVGMPFVTRNQEEGVPTDFEIRRSASLWYSQSPNLSGVIDCHCPIQMKTGTRRDRGVQIDGGAVFPEKCAVVGGEVT